MLDVWITTQTGTNERKGHPTQKPLDLIKKIIKISSNFGDLVCDNFIGSGTTAIACQHLGRDYIGCDNNLEYIKIANERLGNNNKKLTEILDFQ